MSPKKKKEEPSLTEAHECFLDAYLSDYYDCAFKEYPYKARIAVVKTASDGLLDQFALEDFPSTALNEAVRTYFYEKVGRKQSLRDPKYNPRLTSYNAFQQSVLDEIRREADVLRASGDTRSKKDVMNELTKARWNALGEAEQKKWAETAKEELLGELTEQQKDSNFHKISNPCASTYRPYHLYHQTYPPITYWYRAFGI
ncbi:hypothetical protein K474DRAFT_1680644 [Panus rudis PR-1116 ss-1]|nr:hypothetical protein K474DRAFT_1680644 [Panus rudis PR-1116 ss-1]